MGKRKDRFVVQYRTDDRIMGANGGETISTMTLEQAREFEKVCDIFKLVPYTQKKRGKKQ